MALARLGKMVAKTILIIDDDSDIRKILQLTLQKLAGWQVVEAADGLQGIAAAASCQPDAILLDGMMPGLSGAETARKLKQDPGLAQIPVLMLTASVEENYDDLQVQGVLRKPFDPVRLPDQIVAALEW